MKAPIYSHTRCLPGRRATTRRTITRKEKARLKPLIYADIRPPQQRRLAAILVIINFSHFSKLPLRTYSSQFVQFVQLSKKEKMSGLSRQPFSWQIYEAHSFAGVSMDGPRIGLMLVAAQFQFSPQSQFPNIQTGSSKTKTHQQLRDLKLVEKVMICGWEAGGGIKWSGQ